MQISKQESHVNMFISLNLLPIQIFYNLVPDYEPSKTFFIRIYISIYHLFFRLPEMGFEGR